MKKFIIIILCLIALISVLPDPVEKSDRDLKNIEESSIPNGNDQASAKNEVLDPFFQALRDQRYKFEGAFRGYNLYNKKAPSNPDRAFLMCWYAARNGLFDTQFNLDAYNYVGRNNNGNYVVDIYFAERNLFNGKYIPAARCTVEVIDEKNLRMVEMFAFPLM